MVLLNSKCQYWLGFLMLQSNLNSFMNLTNVGVPGSFVNFVRFRTCLGFQQEWICDKPTEVAAFTDVVHSCIIFELSSASLVVCDLLLVEWHFKYSLLDHRNFEYQDILSCRFNIYPFSFKDPQWVWSVLLTIAPWTILKPNPHKVSSQCTWFPLTATKININFQAIAVSAHCFFLSFHELYKIGPHYGKSRPLSCIIFLIYFFSGRMTGKSFVSSLYLLVLELATPYVSSWSFPSGSEACSSEKP